MRSASFLYLIVTIVLSLGIGPMLQAVGLLPVVVLRNFGITYPGSPNLIFGPLMALLLGLCYGKTRILAVFPLIGFVRAAFLGFVQPANAVHLGTGLGGVAAGIVAVMLLRNTERFSLRSSIPILAGIYAGFQTAGNYLTTILLGPLAQQKIILTTPIPSLGVIGAAALVGVGAGLVAYKLLGVLPSRLMK